MQQGDDDDIGPYDILTAGRQRRRWFRIPPARLARRLSVVDQQACFLFQHHVRLGDGGRLHAHLRHGESLENDFLTKTYSRRRTADVGSPRT